MKPVDRYLDASKFDPNILIKIVEDCSSIGNEKEFNKCIVRRLDTEFKHFTDIVVGCYDEYKRTRDFDRFSNCIIEGLRKRKSKMIDLVTYCHTSLKERSPGALYECVLSGLEAVNYATKRAIEEYRRELKARAR